LWCGVAATLPPEEHHWVDKDGNVCEEGSAAVHFCLFDAHDSRLQVHFLEKVNKKMFVKPMWKVCIGLPNGTSKWQLGGSKEQNGS
jgi:hypothetical protein